MRGGEADAVDKCGTQAGTEETTYPSTQTTLFRSDTYTDMEMQINISLKSICVVHIVYKNTQYIQINVTLTGKEETTYPSTQTTLSYFQIRHMNMYRCKFKIKIQILICLQRHKIHTNKCHGGRKIRNRVSLHFYKCNYKVYNTAVVFCLHRFCSTFTLRTIFENMGHLKPSDTLSAQWRPNLNPCEPTGTPDKRLTRG